MIKLSIQRGATGSALIRGTTAAGSSVELFWIGPGAGLYLLLAQTLVRVEHRTADGQYATLAEARGAAAAFIGSIEQPGDRLCDGGHWPIEEYGSRCPSCAIETQEAK